MARTAGMPISCGRHAECGLISSVMADGYELQNKGIVMSRDMGIPIRRSEAISHAKRVLRDAESSRLPELTPEEEEVLSPPSLYIDAIKKWSEAREAARWLYSSVCSDENRAIAAEQWPWLNEPQ